MKRALGVLACGAVTPVGLSAIAAYTAVRAGVSAYAESSYFQKTLPRKPHQVCLVPLRAHPKEEPRLQRLADMASEAIAQCLEGVDVQRIEKTALILCLGEPFRESKRPASESLDGILEAILERLQVKLHPQTRTIAEGNAGPVAALAIAHDLIVKGEVEQCIVGGVDSFLNVADLRRFEDFYRLKQEGVAQGFVPGEGAVFLRVAAARSANATGDEPELAHVLGVGISREAQEVTVLSEGHPTGVGLGKAIENALLSGQISEANVIFRVSDLNGEQYRGIESMLGMSYAYKSRREDIPIWLPAASVGEMGAASGAMLVMMAALGLSSQRAPGPVAMCEASSDQGLRASCVLCPANWSPGNPWPAN